MSSTQYAGICSSSCRRGTGNVIESMSVPATTVTTMASEDHPCGPRILHPHQWIPGYAEGIAHMIPECSDQIEWTCR